MKTIKLLIVLLTLLPALVLAQEKTKTREVELANGDTLTHVTSVDKEDGQVNLYSETDLYNPNKWSGVNNSNEHDCDVGDRQCIEGARSLLLGKDPNIQMHKSMAKSRVEQSPVDAKITKVQTGTEKVQTGVEKVQTGIEKVDCDVADHDCKRRHLSIIDDGPNKQALKNQAKIRVEQSPVDAKITKVQTGIEIKNKVEDKKAADSIQIDPPDPKSDVYTISGATPEHVDAQTSASPPK